MRLGTVLVRIQDTTAEIRVRFAVLLLVALVALAGHLGLETILGAFLAGTVVGLVDRDSSTHPHFRIKLDAIGYGFLIPVFFISSRVRLDLSGLLASQSALLRVPVVPARPAGRPRRTGAALDPPPGPTAVGRVRTAAGDVPSANRHGQPNGDGPRVDDTPITAAALVCAGLLSVLIFPVLALGLLRSAPTPRTETPVVSDASRTRTGHQAAT